MLGRKNEKNLASKKRKLILILIFSLIFLDLILHLLNLNFPQELVFDEIYFFNFIKSYFTGEYFFDIHPPLGKLSIAGIAALLRFGFDQENLFLLRSLPALFGILLIPLSFLLTKKITNSLRAAFLAGIFILFENALLIQSRFVLLSSQLIFFNILTLYSFLSFREAENKRKKIAWLIFSGIFAGVALSIKWTGVSSFGIISFFLFTDWLKERERFEFNNILSLSKKIFLILLIAFTIYITSFYFHFYFLNKPGPGNAFMKKGFKIGLENPVLFLDKFISLNQIMFKENLGIKANHPYSSHWYEWPLMRKTIYYWQGRKGDIYLKGNPIIWIGSTLAVISLITLRIIKKRFPFSKADFLLVSYFANWLPFSLIKRPLFLYHYFTALIIAVIILAILLDKYLPKYKEKEINFRYYLRKEYLTIFVILIVILGFILNLPTCLF
ncbi:MAG: phospholipid carrier-dependent glycosyltransferase [Patescibacteria group bacterium]|nr:phospholipid carrier-dependent glycosyltransferase [Patescibacteria group bacterium]